MKRLNNKGNNPIISLIIRSKKLKQAELEAKEHVADYARKEQEKFDEKMRKVSNSFSQY